MEFQGTLGECHIRILGDDELVGRLEEELSHNAFQRRQNTAVDILFEIRSNCGHNIPWRGGEHLSYHGEKEAGFKKQYHFGGKKKPGAPYRSYIVILKWNDRQSWKVGVYIDTLFAFLNRSPSVMHFLTDNVIEALSLFLCPEKAPFIHGTAVSHNNQGIVFSGSGGVGKTSLMIGLLKSSPSWAYLSDDRTLIDQEGVIQYYPPRMVIKRHYLAIDRSVQARYFASRGTLSRSIWKVIQFANFPRVPWSRMFIKDLFPGQVALRAPLKTILVLEVANVDRLTVEQSSIDEFIRYMADMMSLEEYSDLFHLLSTWNRFSSRDWRTRYISALRSRLESAEVSVLKCKIATQDQLVDLLKKGGSYS